MNILTANKGTAFDGCDFVLQIEKTRPIRLLQLTDMQVIDSSQRRTPDRIRPDEIEAWNPQNFDILCGDHIRSLVTEARPDLIFITGDITYGSFDDNGSTLKWLCSLMDSFGIPWAPVFGNHDNESRMGVEWQCEQFEKSKHCLFKRGDVSGNGNYTIGIAVGDKLLRVLYMIDSNGCKGSTDPSVKTERKIYSDQVELVASRAERIRRAQGRAVDSFVALHIPFDGFLEAERAKGYFDGSRDSYTLGVDTAPRDRDFGARREDVLRNYAISPEDFTDTLVSCGVKAVFAGHFHKVNTCIEHRGIKWVYGLKTGQYDYHSIGQTGGTLVRVDGEENEIFHLASLAGPGPYPIKARLLSGLLAHGSNI